MIRRSFRSSCILVIFFTSTACGGSAPAPQSIAPFESAVPPIPGGRMGVHGMVVFGRGDQAVFFSHIPMFHQPHDVQAIFEVKLDGGPARFDTGLFTWEPERFSLDDLLLGRISTLAGTLYEGSFEQNGRPLQKVTVQVVRTVTAKVFDPHAVRPDRLEYLAVGHPAGVYLVHPITHAPDFDQVLEADIEPGALGDADLRAGVPFIVPGRGNDVAQRLREGSSSVSLRPRSDTSREVRIRVRRELSTLIGPDFVSGP